MKDEKGDEKENRVKEEGWMGGCVGSTDEM